MNPRTISIDNIADKDALFRLSQKHYEEKNYVQAFNFALQSANLGNLDAQRFVGYCYTSGNGVEADDAVAVTWYKKASEAGDAKSIFNLAGRYFYGKGIEKDQHKAFELYLSAAKLGITKSQYKVGLCYVNGNGILKNERDGVVWIEMAANNGYDEAQLYMGYLLWDGSLGLSKDKNKALHFIKSAANQGLPEAQFFLGCAYAHGEVVAKNNDIALSWLQKAAEGGYAEAQMSLGSAYALEELGLKADLKKSFDYYLKAAEQGEREAQFVVGHCYLEGKGVEKNENQALRWIKLSSEANYPEAHLTLGTLYDDGLCGLTQDKKTAFDYYLKASDQGNETAFYFLSNSYVLGEGVSKNETKGIECLKIAADAGCDMAQLELGIAYHGGKYGLKINEHKAFEYFVKAANQENDQAQYLVGVCYALGTGVSKDYNKALIWLKKSKNNNNENASSIIALLEKLKKTKNKLTLLKIVGIIGAVALTLAIIAIIIWGINNILLVIGIFAILGLGSSSAISNSSNARERETDFFNNEYSHSDIYGFPTGSSDGAFSKNVYGIVNGYNMNWGDTQYHLDENFKIIGYSTLSSDGSKLTHHNDCCQITGYSEIDSDGNFTNYDEYGFKTGSSRKNNS